MSIEQLRSIIPPPSSPVFAGDANAWQDVENELGITLPNDYKQLINLYGVGCFGGFVWPLNPFVPRFHEASPFRLEAGTNMMKLFETVRLEDPDAFPPFPAHPSPNGLLPWGVDDTGGLQGWLTNGNPNNWDTIILDNDWSEEFYQYKTSATGFLVGWLTGSIKISFYPEYLLPEPIFQPYQIMSQEQPHG